MRQNICRLFSLNLGEERKVLQFSLLGFLLALTTTIGIRFSDALFLFHVGSQSLPSVYTYISCGMIFLAPVLLCSYHKLEAGKIFFYMASIILLFYSGAFLYFQSGGAFTSEWPWYMLRVAAPLMFYPLTSSFWSFIDQFHHGLDTKRLIGIYVSTCSLGSMTTGLIMSTGIHRVEYIFLLLMGLLVLLSIVAHRIKRTEKPIAEEAAEEGYTEGEKVAFWGKIKAIFTHKYTRLLVIGNVFALLMWVIAEYNYMSAFEVRFVTEGVENTGDLTRFLGKCYSSISVLNVVFGLFIYPRLIRHLGIGSMVLVTPFLFFMTFSGWCLNDAFIFPMMGFLIVEGSYDMVDNSNFSIILKGSPVRIQAMVRVLTLTLFEPLGMLLSGLMLSYAPMDTRSLGMCVAACACCIAISMRAHLIEKHTFNLGLRFRRLVYGQ
jgi:ATP/ADP translocase